MSKKYVIKGQKNRKRKSNQYTELNLEKLIESLQDNQVTIDGEIINFNNVDQILDTRANCIYETKTITSGPVREVEMYPVFAKKNVPEEFRYKSSKKAQKNLDNKNAEKWFMRKANTNFGKGDYYLTLNYSHRHRPKNFEEAKKHVRAYINKLNYEYMKLQVKNENKKLSSKLKKKNYKKIKYMYVVEISKEGKGKYHIHMILSSELSMDLVESCWKYGRRNNIRKIDPDDKHITDLANYLSKDPKGKKRWGCSKGLKEPRITTSKKISKKKIHAMSDNENIIEEVMKKFNPNYKFVKFEVKRNKFTRMPYIHVLMKRIE